MSIYSSLSFVYLSETVSLMAVFEIYDFGNTPYFDSLIFYNLNSKHTLILKT